MEFEKVIYLILVVFFLFFGAFIVYRIYTNVKERVSDSKIFQRPKNNGSRKIKNRGENY